MIESATYHHTLFILQEKSVKVKKSHFLQPILRHILKKRRYEEYVNIAQTYSSYLKSYTGRKEGGNQKIHAFRDVQSTAKLYYKILNTGF